MADEKQDDTNVEEVENTETVENPGDKKQKQKVIFDGEQQKYLNQMDKAHKTEVQQLQNELLEARISSMGLDEKTKTLVMKLAKVSYKEAKEWLDNPENLPEKKEYQNLPDTQTPSKDGNNSNSNQKPISLMRRRQY